MKIKYMVYFVIDGIREGAEIIEANSREEATAIYRRYFNVNKENIKAIPRIEVERCKTTS